MNWRNIGRQLRFYSLDGRSIFLIIFFLYSWSYVTFWILIFGFILLWLIERRGYTLPNAWRKVKAWIGGPHRPSVTPRRQGRSDR